MDVNKTWFILLGVMKPKMSPFCSEENEEVGGDTF